jgi:adenine-specific DNA methylase
MVVAKAKHIFLSYSSEGLIPHHEILDICRDRGVTDFWEVGHRRFKSNGGGSNEKAVRERLYHVKGD